MLLTLIPPLHPGFYKGPKEMNEKKIVRDVLVDGDAWFNFGDVLYLDSDYNVYFRDRTGDTFRLVICTNVTCLCVSDLYKYKM